MFQLPIKSVQDAQAIGQAIAQSGMFGVSNDGAGTIIALMCFQRGISLDEYERTWQFVQGKRSMRYDVMLAKLLELGGDYKILERSKDRAHIQLKREGGEWADFSLTMTDAIESGVACEKDGKTVKQQYRMRPEVMLLSKCVSNGVRITEPRVNFGVYTSEEVEEINENQSTNQVAPGPSPKAIQFPIDPEMPANEPYGPNGGTLVYEQKAEAPAQTTLPASVPDPFASIPADPVDYTVMPIGPHAGKKWAELGHEMLQALKADPRILTKQHLAEIDKALDESVPF